MLFQNNKKQVSRTRPLHCKESLIALIVVLNVALLILAMQLVTRLVTLKKLFRHLLSQFSLVSVLLRCAKCSVKLLRDRRIAEQAVIINNAQQSAAFAQMIDQAVAPLSAGISSLNTEIAGIKCHLPETKVIPCGDNYVKVNTGFNIPLQVSPAAYGPCGAFGGYGYPWGYGYNCGNNGGWG